MATLHLLSHSPFDDGRFASCLRLLERSDAVLLSGDAVYALQPGSAPQEALAGLDPSIHVFALAEDHAARGALPLATRVQLVDYPEFVELCGRYDRVNSWL